MVKAKKVILGSAEYWKEMETLSKEHFKLILNICEQERLEQETESTREEYRKKRNTQTENYIKRIDKFMKSVQPAQKETDLHEPVKKIKKSNR